MVTLLGVLIWLCILFVVGTAYWYLTISRNLPPGPLGIPVFGSTLDLLDVNKQCSVVFEYIKKYGPVFKLYIANKLVVVLGDYDSIQEAFVKQGDVFSGRPQLYTFLPKRCRHLGISMSEGELWKEQRRFALSTLRDFGVGRPILEPRILEEMEHLHEEIKSYAMSGTPFDPQRLLTCSVSNIICQMVFGRRYQLDDEEFVRHITALAKRIAGSGISFLSPIAISDRIASAATWIPAVAKMQKESDELIDYLQQETDKTMDSFDPNAEPTNYVHAFKKAALGRLGGAYTDSQLLAVTNDLFIAGTETSATTLRWAVLLLGHHPEIQEKMYKEIREQIGSSHPSYADRKKMPYAEAVIMELQRYANLVPLGAARRTTQPAKFMGYDIPEDTVVLPFLTGVLFSSELYPEPEKFNPSRFLDADGKVVKDPKLIPFQAGKRICLGESLARMELFLFLVGLVSQFRFYFPSDKPKPSLEPVCGITNAPKPYQICVEMRNNN